MKKLLFTIAVIFGIGLPTLLTTGTHFSVTLIIFSQKRYNEMFLEVDKFILYL